MTTTGHVTAVTRQVLGDQLVADASIGASTLYVGDVADFDEDGGSLSIGGLAYEYAGIDDDLATIDLASALTVAALTDDRVDLWDPEVSDVIVEYLADVTEDGGEDGDPIQALVPHSLIDLLPEGVRGEVGESVEMEAEDDHYVISAVIGKVPVVDGSFLDPTTVPDPIPEPDPAVPAGLVLGSAVALVGRSYQSSITATWSAVTLDVNGDPVGVLAGYDVQIKAGNLASSQPWQDATSTISLTATLPGFAPGSVWCVRVRAHLASGPVSAWSSAVEVTTAVDATAPNTPSTPTVTSRLGALVAAWDGKDSGAAAMPADFAYVEVHVSTTSGFTPTAGSATTLLDRLTGAGAAVKADATYGTTYYVKLLAVDYAGNVSTSASAQGSSAVQPLVDVSNFPDSAMNDLYARTGHFLVVTTAMLSANAAAINFLDVGVLTGVLFQTTATASRGIKIDSTRLRAWDGSGNPTFTIDSATGAVTMVGALESGSSITGSVVQTTATASRGIKLNSTGLHAYDNSGNETVTIDPTTGQITLVNPSLTNLNLTALSVASATGSFGTLDVGTAGSGTVGTGTFRTSVDGRVSAVAPTVTMTSGDVGSGAFRTSVDARVSGIAPTVTMTTGGVGTGTFRDTVDARVWAVSESSESDLTTDASPTSTTNITLAGLSKTITSPGTSAVYIVEIAADVAITTAATTNVIELLVDGSAQTRILTTGRPGTTSTSRTSGFQKWRITGLSAGSHTFTARTRNTAASSGATVAAGNTAMFVKRDA